MRRPEKKICNVGVLTTLYKPVDQNTTSISLFVTARGRFHMESTRAHDQNLLFETNKASRYRFWMQLPSHGSGNIVDVLWCLVAVMDESEYGLMLGLLWCWFQLNSTVALYLLYSKVVTRAQYDLREKNESCFISPLLLVNIVARPLANHHTWTKIRSDQRDHFAGKEEKAKCSTWQPQPETSHFKIHISKGSGHSVNNNRIWVGIGFSL